MAHLSLPVSIYSEAGGIKIQVPPRASAFGAFDQVVVSLGC